jgi:hypothetical protein
MRSQAAGIELWSINMKLAATDQDAGAQARAQVALNHEVIVLGTTEGGILEFRSSARSSRSSNSRRRRIRRPGELCAGDFDPPPE